jgi:hypothetical protein
MRYDVRLTSVRFDRRFAQLAFLAAGLFVPGYALIALARTTTDHGQLIVGGLAAASVAIGLAALSFIVAPRTSAG